MNAKNEYHMGKDNRFHLDRAKPRRKLQCPNCSRRRCFTPYVDEWGLVSFPSDVGRCDHELSCGYHYSPSDYFRDRPDACAKPDWGTAPKAAASAALKAEPDFIDRSVMERTLRMYSSNPLFSFLSRVFGERQAAAICERYNVGTSKKWGGSAVYWQVDKDGNVRTGKIMLYDPSTGHRVKDELHGARVGWAHAELGLRNFSLSQCLFGEHLLPLHPDRTVMLVESEKSALIASGFVPECLWLATGGMHGCFNGYAMRALEGRDVVLFPDLGGYEAWKGKMPMLQPICRSVRISSLLELCASDEHRAKGLDVADFLLMQPTAHMIYHDMCERNPCLKQLAEDLQLEPVEEE